MAGQLAAVTRLGSNLSARLPSSWRLWGRRILFAPYDALSSVLGRRAPLVPPRGVLFVGQGDFLGIGREYAGYLRDLAGLRPDGSVLDVGCGVGRMAAGLTSYLSPRGRYEGFDIVPMGIRWCQRHLTTRFPNFHFQCVRVNNPWYAAASGADASGFRFPYADSQFDVVLVASVFTHLLPAEVQRYLAEIRRVLKPGGRCLATYFVINDDSLALVRRGAASVPVVQPYDGAFVADRRAPRAAIGFTEDWIRSAHVQASLPLRDPLLWGSWCGRSEYLSGQDITLSVRD